MNTKNIVLKTVFFFSKKLKIAIKERNYYPQY